MTGCCIVGWLSLILCSSALAQAQVPPADGAPAELPKLEKFDPSLIDKTKDPCTDFYQLHLLEMDCGPSHSARSVGLERDPSAVSLQPDHSAQCHGEGRQRQAGPRQRAADR